MRYTSPLELIEIRCTCSHFVPDHNLPFLLQKQFRQNEKQYIACLRSNILCVYDTATWGLVLEITETDIIIRTSFFISRSTIGLIVSTEDTTRAEIWSIPRATRIKTITADISYKYCLPFGNHLILYEGCLLGELNIATGEYQEITVADDVNESSIFGACIKNGEILTCSGRSVTVWKTSLEQVTTISAEQSIKAIDNSWEENNVLLATPTGALVFALKTMTEIQTAPITSECDFIKRGPAGKIVLLQHIDYSYAIVVWDKQQNTIKRVSDFGESYINLYNPFTVVGSLLLYIIGHDLIVYDMEAEKQMKTITGPFTEVFSYL